MDDHQNITYVNGELTTEMRGEFINESLAKSTDIIGDDPMSELDFEELDMRIRIINKPDMLQVEHSYVKDDKSYKGIYKLQQSIIWKK